MLRYENPDTGEVRTVTVPRGDPISTGTLHDIADQAGAENFHEFCKWSTGRCEDGRDG